MKALLSTSELEQRMKKIKLLLLDVDGVLTNGTIFYVEGQGWTRTYNVYDGYGIRYIQKLGLIIGVISGGNSLELKERVKMLGITHSVLGSEDKLSSLRQMMKETGFTREQICFVADDLFDLPALREVGLAITVPDAVQEVVDEAHYITRRKGGTGAVREVIDLIRNAQGLKI